MSEKNARKSKNGGAEKASGPMDVALLEKLVKLMAANGLSAVELSDGDKRISLKRGTESSAPLPQMSMVPQAMPATAQAAPARAAASESSDESRLIPIKSPMPGTFYAAPAKGAKPFVAVGSRVEDDTDVCIVEAMKVFSTIKAETRGVIARILVQDSQPVEFGQVLFLVNPSEGE